MKPSKEALEKIDKLEKKFREDVKEILLEEGKRLNPYNIGDIVKDDRKIGKIKRVRYGYSEINYGLTVIYECEGLTKKLQPFKKNKTISIYLKYVKEKLN